MSALYSLISSLYLNHSSTIGLFQTIRDRLVTLVFLRNFLKKFSSFFLLLRQTRTDGYSAESKARCYLREYTFGSETSFMDYVSMILF